VIFSEIGEPALFKNLKSADHESYISTGTACYYRFKGKAFSFDPATDVNLGAFDTKLLKVYLQKYEKRFVDFMIRIEVL